jgi:hypothetical protein
MVPVMLTQRAWGRPPRWEGRIGDLTAEASTKAGAKQAVEALAVEELSGPSTPRLLRVPDSPLMLLVWREPGLGWSYKIVGYQDAANPPKLERLWGSSGGWSREEAERHGRHHLAQFAFDLHGDAAAFSVVTDEEDRRRLASWIGFQHAYRAARAAGEADPHRWAGDHAEDFAPETPTVAEGSTRIHLHDDGPPSDILVHLEEEHDPPAEALASVSAAEGWHGEQQHG